MAARPDVESEVLSPVPIDQSTKSSVSASSDNERRSSTESCCSSPSQSARNGSPKSPASTLDSAVRIRSKAPSFTGCRFETGMAYSRRRIPYSVGDDPLPPSKGGLRRRLDIARESRLTEDLQRLYQSLLPSPSSLERREHFVQRLEQILNKEWPKSLIKVHVFGSSGNLLSTDESDVDICITTGNPIPEKTCLLAEVLAQSGMERIVCVPHAKVPIVKFWDPQAQLACDMNINNTLALENTKMIRTYVRIDDRVRPLAMIIKHWAKRRILNDAALGGTLSSYTWICMILNFLQTRNAPILPALPVEKHSKTLNHHGSYTSFSGDLDRFQSFGAANTDSLGELFFQFFQFYGYDFDYEQHVLSVREGRLMPKEEKQWHLQQSNRLGVEEPFNTDRNLGNTADDSSFRGIHLELRRAYDLICDGKLEQCLEEYEFPAVGEKLFERPAPRPVPVTIRSRSQSQSNRGVINGPQTQNDRSTSGTSYQARRASSGTSSSKNPAYMSGAPSHHDRLRLTPEELLYAQYEQWKLHKQLYDEMQTLQRQEWELRMRQLENQMQAEYHLGISAGTLSRQPGILQDASGGFPINQLPLMFPTRGGMPFPPIIYPQVAGTPHMQTTTQPSSPALKSTQNDLRRNMQRSHVGMGHPSSSSYRSHSQPPRGISHHTAFAPTLSLPTQRVLQQHGSRRTTQLPTEYNPTIINGREGRSYPVESLLSSGPGMPALQPRVDGTGLKEYAGYWINDPASQTLDYSTFGGLQTGLDYPRPEDGLSTAKNGLRSQMAPLKSSTTPTAVLRDRAHSLQSYGRGYMQRQRCDRVPGTIPALRYSRADVNDPHYLYRPYDYGPIVDCPSQTTTMSEGTSGSDDVKLETPMTADLEPGIGDDMMNAFAIDQQLPSTLPSMIQSSREDHSYRTEDLIMRRNPPQPSLQTAAEDMTAIPAASTGRSGEGLGRPLETGGQSVMVSQFDRKEPRNVDIPSLSALAVSTSAKTRLAESVQAEKKTPQTPSLSPVREVRTPSPAAARHAQLISTVKRFESSRSRIPPMDLHIPAFGELVKARQAREKTKQADQVPFPAPINNAIEKNGFPYVTNEATLCNGDPPVSTSKQWITQPPQSAGWQQTESKRTKRHRPKVENEHGTNDIVPIPAEDRKGG